MSLAMNIFYVLSLVCSSFLFLRRFHAVYAHNRIAWWIFTILWIGAVACIIPALTGFHMEHIQGTDYCTPYKIEEYVSVVDFLPGAFDTLVFFAISYRLLATRDVARREVGLGKVIMGKTLPQLSRALLHSGQKYYLSVASSNFSDTIKG